MLLREVSYEANAWQVTFELGIAAARIEAVRKIMRKSVDSIVKFGSFVEILANNQYI